MYSKIIVPLDGSPLAEQVLSYVRLLAEAQSVPVELLRVTDEGEPPPSGTEDAGALYLKKIATQYFSGAARTATEGGSPATVIVDRAKSDHSCLIAMATHGMSGMRRWLLGSVAAKVAQAAANPLLLVRPGDREPTTPVALKTVFVPLDGSALGEKVLPHVTALGKTMNLEVHLVRVYKLPVNAYVVADGVLAQGPAQFREPLRAEAETYLEAKAEQLRANGVARVTATALEGDPADEINGIARTTPNSLIAMSTHGRSGIGRWVLGSVTEKVIQHSRDPVLVIRSA